MRGILDRTHLRFFTEKSLRPTLIEHGYRIESFGGINRLRFSRFDGKRILLLVLTILSFGLYRDAWYEQFAVRATPAP